ncbi:DUF3592 domain-containing protein [Capsulimonas corticalis]|nr:DUF3592 domain-containing protein [Capsulimonas corticalis]
METTINSKPAEILERPPRPARFTTGTQTARVTMVLLLLGTFGLLSWLGMRDMNELRALQAHGRMMGALITDKTVRHGKHDTYYLDYDFYVNQTFVTDRSSFDYGTWDNAVIGGSIPVTYLPANPHTYRLGVMTEDRIAGQGRAWFWTSIVALAILGLFTGALEWTFQEQLTLMRDGVAVAGFVMGREVIHSTDYRNRNARPKCYVTYTIPIGPAGRIYKVETPSWSLMYDLDVSQPLVVLCDPAQPARNRPLFLMTAVRV